MEPAIRLLKREEWISALPLIQELNPGLEEALLQNRLEKMKQERYELAGMWFGKNLVGLCGMWEIVRVYSGKQIEIDNVIIGANHRNGKLGQLLMNWVYNYARSRGCESVELNTYSSNTRSHKFYYNEGFEIKGFHMIKRLNVP